ncbi:ribonucleoside-diphosphate reductase [Schleiferilactobacillus harbinensis]|uniref:ribonucleoside-diphosphate reductase n=1 Tax=Schleiferilactobacillus harbinensis TaxID=304207 RepID=UPI002672A5B4|nr:ribonucleoside-diphosphate reductase [Schleiferilactobacillus harbinensis]
MPKMIHSKYGYEPPEYVKADAEIEKWLKGRKKLQAIVYTKPGCMKCRQTVRQLSKAMHTKDVTATADDINALKAGGVQSMPAVYIFEGSKPIDYWSDLRVDKIKQYTEG